MSPLSFKELWNGKHIKEDESGDAARKAAVELSTIDTKDFSDSDVAKQHGELSRIAVVTALSAAKKSKSWPAGREHLMLAMKAILDSYSLAATHDQAATRGDYWELVYGAESAQFICLRDILNLLRVLGQIFPDEGIENFMGGIKSLLDKLSDGSEERFALIYLSEEADYPVAKDSYLKFLTNKLSAPSQLITVSARMLGRAVDNRDLDMIAICLNNIAKLSQSNSDLLKFILKELIKNFSLLKKEQIIKKKLESFKKQSELHPSNDLQPYIAQLIKQVFVGLGDHKVAEIDSE